MRLIKVDRKSQVLKKPDFKCLRGIPTINITRGCWHRCVYCYARSFPQTPSSEVWLYQNLPQRLREELRAGLRRGTLPAWVAFSTASDCFQPLAPVLDVCYQTMALLLESGVGVSFLTKGVIPRRFLELFKGYPGKVFARIGLVSVSHDYWRLFEPRAAPPAQRLLNLASLVEAGLEVSVRIDPIIPGVTDHPERMEQLFRRLASLGVREVSLSYLVLRPGVKRQMIRALPHPLWRAIEVHFRGQPWQKVITSATTKLVRKPWRLHRLRLFAEIGRFYHLEVKVCGCKNPDLPFSSCDPWPALGESRLQLGLFDPGDHVDRSPSDH
ncbi:radical SAM protein [Thermosulfuriphilus ammonigenes]|uniref:Radical SAM protein n=1 Tax=Thermosulfuriphilus ammonigenes TaxID=1936021 RepID=A0A6G7PXM6_9BACT|nr:radical SAM protein [Thermosulfuriphilus ammonigenes]MBA2849336.1 DNA repair photolyase [Thermosulfuriphilus ammonigenes]QIJ72412.1 radical SAM protein [Thermosulfuriphilus ammonigenes]